MADGSVQLDDPKTKLEVRLGTPDEVDEVMRLALMGTAENGFLAANPAKVLADIWAALNLHQGMVGCIGEIGGTIEGAVLLRVGNIWYADEPVIEERAVFVDPAYRSAKGGRATRLIEYSRWVADEMQMPLVIGVLSAHRTEAKVRAYSRIMGQSSGAYWIYWPKGHAQHVGA